MKQSEFEKLVAEGYDRLPQWVRDKIKNVALLIEDEPSDEVREAEGLDDDETLLGYYQGIPLSARGEGYGVGRVLPHTITLYQLPIEEEANELGGGEAAVRKVIRETIWHEVAHHFGMDEHEVQERERKNDA